MRVFVAFREVVHSLDVNVSETVGDIKNTLRERFGLNLKNHRHETDSFVSLLYQGSALQDGWTYSDLGIPPGSTLVCRVEKQVEATLTVCCINYEETIVYKQRFDVWGTSVGRVRGMIQTSTGIHVSAFRLYSESGLELFDCHPLKVYGVDVGDTVTMEIWHDVADVIQAARENDITDTLCSLASFQDSPHLMRYQLQLGLFTAAHYGYHQLATQLMKCGARPDEPVGQHPSRDWCRSSAHADHVKSPAHEAAQHGRLKCLQHFLMFNHAVLICKDAHGLTPCNIARRYKQTECFKLLVAEQFRIPSVHPELSVYVYARVRKWCDRARLRTRLHKDKTTLLLLTNAEVTQKHAVVGQKVEVDGFNGFQSGRDRKIKSAPSLTACNKITRNYSSARGIPSGNVESKPSSNPEPFVNIKRTKSDVSFQVPCKAGKAATCNASTKDYSSARTIASGNVESKPSSNPGPFVNMKRTKSDVSSQLPCKTATCNASTKDYSSARAIACGNVHSNPSSDQLVHRTKSDVTSEVNCKADMDNGSPRARAIKPRDSSNTSGKSYQERSISQKSNIWQDSQELSQRHRVLSDGTVYSKTPLRHQPSNSTLGRINSTSSATPRATRVGITRGEHELSRAGITRREHTGVELGKSDKEQNPRYIWKSLDNQENLRISKDIRGQISTSSVNDQQEPIVSNDIPTNIISVEYSASAINNTDEKPIPQDDRSVLSRSRIGTCRRSFDINKQSVATITCETRHARKREEPNSSFKRRSAQSRGLVYQSSVDSTADKCLRVACETFRKKSWLGQLQMALVVNTNMCKRRHNVLK